MSELFSENKNFFSTEGVLGRRDFLVNCLIIKLLEAVFWITPLGYEILLKPELISIIDNSASRPLWISISIVIVGIIASILFFPSIVRRIRDISASSDTSKITMISTILTVIIFMSYTPVGNTMIGNCLFLFVVFYLLFTQGKITGEKPNSEIIKFNWGAFLGTWVWGFVNKKPITLLFFPLLLTCGWFHFMLICGLKGNEWLYEDAKNKTNDIEEFHRTQSLQSTVLTVLAPVIFLACILFLSSISMFSLRLYSNHHPDFIVKLENFYNKYQTTSVTEIFEKIELEDNEYKFYIAPDYWQAASKTWKRTIFKNAMAYTLIQKGIKITSFDHFVKNIEEINKIKIYSSFNNESLASFYLPPKETLEKYEQSVKDKQLKRFQELWNTGYKFNTNPTMP